MRTRKILYLICLAAVVILNCLYVDYQFMLLLLMIIIIPAASYLRFAASRIGIKLYIRLENSAVSANDEIEAVIKIKSKYRIRFSCAKLEIQVMYSNNGGTDTYTEQISEDSSREFRFSFVPKHCGTVMVYIKGLTVRDSLGLFCAKYKYNCSKKAVVLPEKIGGGHSGRDYEDKEQEYILSFLETDNTEIMDLRKFQEGDPINRVHWKLSVNSDELIVRQYGEEIEYRNSILVDLTKTDDSHFREHLDLIYQAAYSIGSFYVGDGVPARFIVWDGQENEVRFLDFQDEESLAAAMYELMSVKCQKDAFIRVDFAELLKSSVSGRYLVLITSQDYDSGIYETVNVVSDDLESFISFLEEEN